MTIKHLLISILAISLLSCHPQKDPVPCQNKLPEWAKDAVIYEVNIRQYTPEGTFNAFEKHLPRLKEMGVDILWLMPVHPIGVKNRKGNLGSYYSVQDYVNVSPDYGKLEDFRSLVKKSHELGMKIIIDWVANHTAWDHAWVEQHPDFYAKDSTGQMFGPYDWTDVAQLNYANQELWEAMIQSMKFWVDKCDIDGFRCDVAGLVPVEFWNKARKNLEEIKPIFMLAENEDKPELLQHAFQANYAWSMHSLMNQVARGEKTAIDISNYFMGSDTIYPTGSFAMHFTSNHDENSWNGTEYERMGDAARAFAVLSFTAPGMPLIYSGQEASLNKRLNFFEKDTITWDNLEMGVFYKQLATLKENNPALWNGMYGGKTDIISTNEPHKVLAFSKDREDNCVITLLNLSKDTVWVTVPSFIGKQYWDYLDHTSATFSNQPIRLSPWEYNVYLEESQTDDFH